MSEPAKQEQKKQTKANKPPRDEAELAKRRAEGEAKKLLQKLLLKQRKHR